MDVARDGRHADGAGVADSAALVFHKGEQMGDGLFHGACAFDHLGHVHLACAEEVADHAHAGHEWAFDDVEWFVEIEASLFGILDDEIVYDVYERVAEAFFDAASARLE